MIETVEKTTPSEDILLTWLAGIVDGEGSIGVYTNNQGSKALNFSIVNTDQKILQRVEDIYQAHTIFYSKYLHTNRHPKGYQPRKPCYVITVRRRDDFEKILLLIEPILVGQKKKSAQVALAYLKENPRTLKPVYYCTYCSTAFLGRKRKFCSLDCWHKFSIGEKNPNYRHGKYIACND